MRAPIAICGVVAVMLASMASVSACPTGAAMAGDGVWIETSDTGTLHFRRGAENEIVETSAYPGEAPVVTHSHHGLYLLKDGTLENGEIDPPSLSRYAYPDLAALPHPDSAGTWATDVEVFGAGASVPTTDRFTFYRGDEVQISIAGCTYAGRIIVTRLIHEDNAGEWTTQYVYISELGIAVFLAAGESPFRYELFFRPISISETRP